MEEHLLHAKELIERLTAVDLIFNLEKCYFAQRSLLLLGFSLSATGVIQAKEMLATQWTDLY